MAEVIEVLPRRNRTRIGELVELPALVPVYSDPDTIDVRAPFDLGTWGPDASAAANHFNWVQGTSDLKRGRFVRVCEKIRAN